MTIIPPLPRMTQTVAAKIIMAVIKFSGLNHVVIHTELTDHLLQYYSCHSPRNSLAQSQKKTELPYRSRLNARLQAKLRSNILIMCLLVNFSRAVTNEYREHQFYFVNNKFHINCCGATTVRS